ncbi:MAG: hypothetical protein MJ032_01295 [Acidaminococcaceae bacterium]|nr:hypothetical protein [Acidaminococcaceae bacterium]
MKKFLKFLIVIVVIASACFGYYFFYFTKTPLYSLKLIKDAVQTKDIILFEQHVDVDSILDKGYDAVFKYYAKQQKEFDPNSPLVMGFAQMMKPALVGKVAADIKSTIREEFGSTEKKERKVDSNKQEEKISVPKLQLKEVKEEVKHDSDAIVSFVMTNKNGEDMTFRCKMVKIENGEWKINEIMNIGEIIKHCTEKPM